MEVLVELGTKVHVGVLVGGVPVIVGVLVWVGVEVGGVPVGVGEGVIQGSE